MSFKEIVDVHYWPKKNQHASDFDPVMTLVISLAMILVAFTLALRGFVTYQGVVLQLTLLVASLMSSSILVARAQCNRWWEFSVDCVFAVLVMTSIWVWSPSFALSMTLSLPPVALIGLRLWLQIADIQFAIVGAEQVPSTPRVDVPSPARSNDNPFDNSACAGLAVEAITPEIPSSEGVVSSGQTEATMETEENPWQFVHDQFKVDESLVQNVAQWQEQDGNRCVVANMRCRFSEASETRVLHLPFWPLMNSNPQVFCRIADGNPATVKATQVTPHGIRLEVQLDSKESQAVVPCDVLVEIVASEEAESSEYAA